MKLGFIGLGKMGSAMTHRLLNHGHDIVTYDVDRDAIDRAVEKGAVGSESYTDLVHQLESEDRKIIWLMVPAGEIVDETLEEVAPLLGEGDIIVDGGNSNFNDTIERAKELATGGVEYVDAGTSGGLYGEEIGYCQMIGGKKDVVEYLDPLFQALNIEEGYAHMGDVGSGHYVKMVHNAIEYGMMQSMAEGFELLANGPFEDVDLKRVTHVWNNGSIIRSYLMELAETAFHNQGNLDHIEDHVNDSGEGRWAVETAIDHAIPFTVNTHAVYARFRSRQEASFGAKTLAALRNEFGGHAVKTDKDQHETKMGTTS